MSYNIMESTVRQRLREKNGQVYCADCLAKDLEQDSREVRAAMEVLAPRQDFSAGSCPCGQQDSCFAGRARRGSHERGLPPKSLHITLKNLTLRNCCRFVANASIANIANYV